MVLCWGVEFLLGPSALHERGRDRRDQMQGQDTTGTVNMRSTRTEPQTVSQPGVPPLQLDQQRSNQRSSVRVPWLPFHVSLLLLKSVIILEPHSGLDVCQFAIKPNQTNWTKHTKLIIQYAIHFSQRGRNHLLSVTAHTLSICMPGWLINVETNNQRQTFNSSPSRSYIRQWLCTLTPSTWIPLDYLNTARHVCVYTSTPEYVHTTLAVYDLASL